MERFWSKVEIGKPDECWPWKANTHRQGYGFFKYKGENRLAHRVSFCLENGIDILSLDPKTKILHSCDNEPCCNPGHLFDGSQKDNIYDMIVKGRRGSCSAKVTPEQVVAIREDGRPYGEIAKDYGLSYSGVYYIATRRRWKGAL